MKSGIANSGAIRGTPAKRFELLLVSTRIVTRDSTGWHAPLYLVGLPGWLH